ncbi:MAG: hypothetical protein RMJ98_07700 [Myxococcales bacterium]|nr:hypothetical protein [Polyangiaceae bacterium]MDW8249170.1 hypothetical protein [Myxococcales bacterium]
MSRARIISWIAPIWLASCTLPLKDQNEIGLPTNSCPVDGDLGGTCGPEGECLRGLCRPTQAANLELVFLVYRSQLSGRGLLQPIPIFAIPPLEQLRTLARQGGNLDRVLPSLGSLSLSLLGPDPAKSASTSARGCFFAGQAPNRTLPFHATLRPSSSLRGLPLETFAENATDPNKISPAFDLRATFSIPPATYDLYVVPAQEDACPIPPLLRTDLELPDQLSILSIELPPTSRLGGTIQANPSLDLSSWTLQLVEGHSGLRVSTVAGLLPSGEGRWTIGTPYEGGISPLEYYRPTGPGGVPTGTLFLLLSPPQELQAPRFAWELSSIDLFGTGQIDLDLGDFALPSVSIELRTERAQPLGGQSAWVWFESLLTPGSLFQAPEGAITAFALGPLPTDLQGNLALSLPPGRYKVGAAASSNERLDLASGSFEFLPDLQDPSASLAGFSLQFLPSPSLEIPILSATSNQAFAKVPFELTSTHRSSTLRSLFGLSGVTPRGAAGQTSPDGVLRAGPDSGVHDLVIRIPPSSGFPWLVKPSVNIPLPFPGALRVSLPVEVQGRILDPVLADPIRRPFAGAWLRAFALVDGRYIPIAATPLEPNGAYRLLLPSQL